MNANGLTSKSRLQKLDNVKPYIFSPNARIFFIACLKCISCFLDPGLKDVSISVYYLDLPGPLDFSWCIGQELECFLRISSLYWTLLRWEIMWKGSCIFFALGYIFLCELLYPGNIYILFPLSDEWENATSHQA